MVGQETMPYIFRQIDDTYVVWYAPAKRYMHLQEPAFRVFEDWNKRLPEEQIVLNCAEEFQLSLAKSRCFVKQVTCQLQKFACSYKPEDSVISCEKACTIPDHVTFSSKSYLINGKLFHFRYGNPQLEELIHPGFNTFLSNAEETVTSYTFNLFFSGDQLILQTNGKCWKCHESKQENYIGQVYTQLSNCLYHVTDAHWMGAVRASAVSAGKGAVLFTAPSGSGKSTFAAMLMKEGYQVLSDDFSLLSAHQNKVYAFPEGISIKNQSLPLLKTYFPSLADQSHCLPNEVCEGFLPVNNGELPEPAKVSAIVFLQYDQKTTAELKKISNLDVMNRFIRELWLPPNSEVASPFMDWFFQMPCYTLNYSNAEKAIKLVSGLLQATNN